MKKFKYLLPFGLIFTLVTIAIAVEKLTCDDLKSEIDALHKFQTQEIKNSEGKTLFQLQNKFDEKMAHLHILNGIDLLKKNYLDVFENHEDQFDFERWYTEGKFPSKIFEYDKNLYLATEGITQLGYLEGLLKALKLNPESTNAELSKQIEEKCKNPSSNLEGLSCKALLKNGNAFKQLQYDFHKIYTIAKRGKSKEGTQEMIDIYLDQILKDLPGYDQILHDTQSAFGMQRQMTNLLVDFKDCLKDEGRAKRKTADEAEKKRVFDVCWGKTTQSESKQEIQRKVPLAKKAFNQCIASANDGVRYSDKKAISGDEEVALAKESCWTDMTDDMGLDKLPMARMEIASQIFNDQLKKRKIGSKTSDELPESDIVASFDLESFAKENLKNQSKAIRDLYYDLLDGNPEDFNKLKDGLASILKCHKDRTKEGQNPINDLKVAKDALRGVCDIQDEQSFEDNIKACMMKVTPEDFEKLDRKIEEAKADLDLARQDIEDFVNSSDYVDANVLKNLAAHFATQECAEEGGFNPDQWNCQKDVSVMDENLEEFQSLSNQLDQKTKHFKSDQMMDLAATDDDSNWKNTYIYCQKTVQGVPLKSKAPKLCAMAEAKHKEIEKREKEERKREKKRKKREKKEVEAQKNFEAGVDAICKYDKMGYRILGTCRKSKSLGQMALMPLAQGVAGVLNAGSYIKQQDYYAVVNQTRGFQMKNMQSWYDYLYEQQQQSIFYPNYSAVHIGPGGFPPPYISSPAGSSVFSMPPWGMYNQAYI